MLLLLLACAPKVPMAAPAEHPLLLWRVEREGKASHLFGTCHMGVGLDYALPDPHGAALDQARVVYTEADLDLSNPARIVSLLWSEGPGLSERLPDADWRAIATAVRATLPAPLFEHMEAWALAGMIPLATGGDAASTMAAESMDVSVQKRATARNIPVKHVETLEEQAALLGGLEETFLAALVPSDPEKGRAVSEALTALCFAADTRGADVITEPGDPASEVMLGARNRAWVPKLLPELTEGGVFVAVGAGHMLGDDGLLALLRAEGFTLSQLTTTRPPVDGKKVFGGAGVPPAPPAPALLPMYEAQISDAVGKGLCADGQLLRACFEPDATRCAERITTDTRLCVRQYADQLPTDGGTPSPALQQSLSSCAPIGLILEAIAGDRVGDGPQCGAVKAALQAAGG